MAPQHITTREGVEEFLNNHDVFLFDCDGVLWAGDKLLPSVKDTLDLLRSRGKQLVFVTNNSTKSRKDYVKKFMGYGIKIQENEVFGSAYSSAIFLSKVAELPKGKEKVFIIGEEGLEQELEEAGIEFCGGTDAEYNRPITGNDFATMDYDPKIGAVLVGLDRNINYLKLTRALLQIQHKDTLFLATNIDSTFPSNGKKLPGAGTMSAPLTFATGGKIPIALGKPSQEMMDCIVAKFDLPNPRDRVCMVGDRLNTDIEFGNNGGLSTLLVLTGISTVEDMHQATPQQTPSVYMNKLGDIYDLLKE